MVGMRKGIISATYIVGPTIPPAFLLVSRILSDDCLSRESLPTFLGRGEGHQKGACIDLKSGCGGER